MSIQANVLKSLKTGRQFTPKQLASLFSTTEGTIRARISDLRYEGFSIENTTNKSGRNAYVLRTSR